MLQPMKTIFNIPDIPATAKVEVRDDKHPMVPKIDPLYVFRKELISDVMAWIKFACGNDPLYLTGPTGTGKSSIVTQVAARLGSPLYVVSCHERMEIPELFGRHVVSEGSMLWKDGPLVTALKTPGAWCLLDEVDTLDPGTFIGLNAILEGRSISIPETGEILDPYACGSRIIVAGNTAGNGDSSGLYLSTKRQNLASMGRFMVVEVGYPEPAVEMDILAQAVPTMPQDVRARMIAITNDIRNLFVNGGLEITMCTRSLVRWANLATFFKSKPGIDPITYSLDRAIGYRAEPASRQALHELCQRHFGGGPNGRP
jgi:cobaltochelatase CobS